MPFAWSLGSLSITHWRMTFHRPRGSPGSPIPCHGWFLPPCSMFPDVPHALNITWRFKCAIYPARLLARWQRLLQWPNEEGSWMMREPCFPADIIAIAPRVGYVPWTSRKKTNNNWLRSKIIKMGNSHCGTSSIYIYIERERDKKRREYFMYIIY